MAGKRVKPYIIGETPARLHGSGHRYIAVSLQGNLLFPDAPVSGKSEEVVRQRMTKKHPDYAEQSTLFSVGGTQMSLHRSIDKEGEQR